MNRMINKKRPLSFHIKTKQTGSAIAWILVFLFLISSIVGWYFYLQTNNALDKNKKQKQRLQQRYSQKSDELYKSWNKLENLNEIQYKLNSRIKKYQNKNSQLSKDFEQCTIESKQKVLQVSQCKNKNKQIEANLTLTLQEIQTYKDQLKKLEEDSRLLSSCTKKANKLNSLLNEKQQTIDAQDKSLQHLIENNDKQVRNEESQLNISLTECQSTIVLQSKKFSNYEKEVQLNITKLNNEKQQLLQQLLENKKKLDASLDKQQILLVKMDNAEKTIENLKKQIANLSSDIEDLKTELKNSRQHLKKQQGKETNNNQLLKNRQLITSSLNKQLKQMNSEKVKLKNQLVLITNVKTECQKQLERVKAKQSALKSLLTQSKEKYQICQQELINKTSALKKQQTNLVENNLHKEQQQEDKKYQVLEMKYQLSEKKLNSAMDKNKQLRSLNQQLKDENRSLNEDLQEINQAKSQLQEKLSYTLKGNQYLVRELQRIDTLNKKEVEAFNLLRDKFKAEIKNNYITIAKQKDTSTRIKIGNDLMFAPGQIHISPQGAQILNKISKLLKNFPNRKIEVIGHTDNIPVRSGAHKNIVSNWELSAARAGAAIRYLQHATKISPQRMLLVGASQYQPIAKHDDDISRAKNRRIEIRLLPEQIEVKNMLR